MNSTLINSVADKRTFDSTQLNDVSQGESEVQICDKSENTKSLPKGEPPALHVLSEAAIKAVVSSSGCVTSTTNVKTTRMVPLVYIQAPTNLKCSTAITSAGNTKSNSPVIINANAQFQISTLNKLKANTTMSPIVLSQSGVNSKPQPIILQKSTTNSTGQTLIPVTVATSTGTKQTFAYLGTIIKQQGAKTSENQIVVPSSHLPVGLVPAPTNQKVLFTSMTMPRLTPRTPITSSTSTTTQPKLSNLILPMSLNTQIKNQSVINFKISNGQIQSDPKGSITVLCDSKPLQNNNENDKLEFSKLEKIDSENSEPKTAKVASEKPLKEKVYELSIAEVTTTSLNRELSYTVSIPEEESKLVKSSVIKRTISTDTKEPISDLDDSINQSIAIKSEPQLQRKTHEVSILKKCNLNALDRKPVIAKLIEQAEQPKSEIIDSESVSNKNSEVTEIKTEIRKVNPERRRKSQYTYLRDYDEVVVTSGNAWENKVNPENKKIEQFQTSEITLTKLSCDEDDKDNIKKSPDDVIEIELVKQQQQQPNVPQISTTDDQDIKGALKWKDGIGLLPGSKLKFHINEFGMVEMLMEDEIEKLKVKKEEPSSADDIVQCTECGVHGMASDFISRSYCSKTCKVSGIKSESKRSYFQDVKAKRKKKRFGLIHKQKSEELLSEDIQMNNVNANSDDENSNDMLNQDNKLQNYPWQSGKKSFSWSKYLDHFKAKSAPVKLFKDPFPYIKNGFRPGMKLEGIDPQHPSYFCVMSVSEVQGYRIRLHFDGYPENYDFWVNADSMDIFPVGWCEKNNHLLHPPPSYSMAEFNWNNYLKQCRAPAAPRHLFAHRSGNSVCPNGFRLGMKLEAVDKKNTSLVCVATVTDLMDNRFLVHFDSWDDIYDYWADPSSPYIHPVGWCDQYGHNLTPPNDYPNPESFTWEKYLKETKSVAAPVRAFKQRPCNGFKRDMKLECVDKRIPALIRVSTVDDVREHQIKVRFDGWLNKYSYWIDDDSPDIHPAGWCQKTGHTLESPLTPEDVYENLECPTVGCRGTGHIQGPKYTTHSTSKDCPYSDENLDADNVLPDRLRLTGTDFVSEQVVPVSREPKDKVKSSRLGRPPIKLRRLTETSSKPEWSTEDDSSDTNRKRKISNQDNMTNSELSDKIKLSEDLNNRFKSLINSEYPCPSQQVLAKHTKILNELISTNSQDARTWSQDEVAEFVNSLPSCKEHSGLFITHKIDGEALLMLTQKDLVDILKFKLGPAIKLYNSIVLLRQNVNFYN